MNSEKRLKKELENGVSFEDALGLLRNEKYSPMETIIAIQKVKNVGLGEAKQLFCESNSWCDVAVKADALHQEIIESLENESKDS